MIFNMHCRPSSPTNDFSYSSFLSPHSNCTNTLKHDICSPSTSHDQVSAPTLRSRRRLEDPVVSYASNYYVTNPRQVSLSPSSSPPRPSSRQIHQKSNDKNIYCDLFNLLERPPPMKQKKKHISKDLKPSRSHRSIVYKNVHAKIKDINERKRYQQQQSSCSKEKKHQKENFASTQPYDQLEEKEKHPKRIYQQHLPSKGFFRRVVRNYFCMSMTVAYEELSN